MTYDEIADRATRCHLDILGGFTPSEDDQVPIGTKTLVLLGPLEPGFWQHISGTPEFADGRPDPVDRWSSRVIGKLAANVGAQAVFPFSGPPYLPFFSWALRSSRVWSSPINLLVHDTAGLMVSFRGALALSNAVDLPETSKRPCDECADQPCRSACPVSALMPAGYDVPRCHGHLTQMPAGPCMSAGCLARRACPISQSYARDPAQSAYHMDRFFAANRPSQA